MKSAVLFAVLFIGLATCHVRFFHQAEHTIEDFAAKKDDIFDFFDGLFGHFNLSTPYQIHECFNNINSNLYFQLIQELNRIFEETKERNSFKLHLEYGKLAILHGTLKDTHACISMTQDFSDLLDALNVKRRDPEMFNMALYLYYQAHYLDLFEGFKPVIDNLNSASNNAAGDAFGGVINDLVQASKKEGLSHLAFAGFGNGAAITLDVDEPNDSLQCYDKNASRLYLEFTYKLAVAVSEGGIKEAPLSVLNFMEGEGKEILNQIPASVFECEAQSDDIQKINSKLGVNVTSKEFGDRMIRYINDNRFNYYATCKNLKSALENHNFHHAGSIHAHFIRAVAKAKF